MVDGRLVLFALATTFVVSGCIGAPPRPGSDDASESVLDASLTPAPGSSTLHGKIVDAVGSPVQGVPLLLSPSGGATTTLADGSWAFRSVEPGTYWLIADPPRGPDVEQPVALVADVVSSLRIALPFTLGAWAPTLVERDAVEGLLACAYNPYYSVHPCQAVSDDDESYFRLSWDATDDLTEVALHLAWTPAAAFTGKELQLEVCRSSTTDEAVACAGADLSNDYHERAWGESPVIMRVPIKDLGEDAQSVDVRVSVPVASAYPAFDQPFTLTITRCYAHECSGPFS